MANEITVLFSMSATKNGITIARNPGAVQIDWAGGTYVAQTASIGTSYEALPAAADLGDSGLMWIYNAGSASVAISFDGGTTDHLVIGAGEFQFLRLATAIAPEDVEMKSLGEAAVTIEYVILSA